ncbi:hypothetical protein [Ereboglobus luteus]|uniref:hypothetical protein n=1 Tax=Ereboglobus luteus TaxID=1796921 RepID=UPI00126028D0|nr:hypothetical protein [Ereboglobus luteus]
MKSITILLLIISFPLTVLCENADPRVTLTMNIVDGYARGVLVNQTQNIIKYHPDVSKKAIYNVPACFSVFYKLKNSDEEFGPYKVKPTGFEMRKRGPDGKFSLNYSNIDSNSQVVYSGKAKLFLEYLSRWKIVDLENVNVVRIECGVDIRLESPTSATDYTIKQTTPWYTVKKNAENVFEFDTPIE